MPKPVRLACEAMATRFELVLYGRDQVRTRAAGEEAVGEIQRLHRRLTAFDPTSWIGRLNKHGPTGPVRVAPELFRLLQRIQRLSEITDGAFDITVGPLLDIWGFRGTVSERPDDEKIRKTLAMVGMSRLELNRPQRTVLFRTEGMKLDLGGIGKGYALDIAADILQSAGVESALLHGGTSSVRVLGVDPSGKPWRIAIGVPHASSTDDTLGSVSLVDESMSVSAPSGRMVDLDAGTFGHVIDPRIGQPVREADLAVCVAPTATDSDALATGLMVLGRTGIPQLGRHVVGFRGAVVIDGEVIQSTETIETDLTEAP